MCRFGWLYWQECLGYQIGTTTSSQLWPLFEVAWINALMASDFPTTYSCILCRSCIKSRISAIVLLQLIKKGGKERTFKYSFMGSLSLLKHCSDGEPCRKWHVHENVSGLRFVTSCRTVGGHFSDYDIKEVPFVFPISILAVLAPNWI